MTARLSAARPLSIGRRRPVSGALPPHALDLEIAGRSPAAPSMDAYALLLTAVGLCVRRHGGATRFAVASPLPTGRPPGAVPVHLDLAGAATIGELVRRTKAAVREAYAAPDTSVTADVTCRLDGLHGEPPPLPRPSVAVAFELRDGHVTGRVELDAGLFGPDEARWFRDHLQHVVRNALAASGDEPPHAIDELPPDLHRLVTVEWSGAAVRSLPDDPARQCLHRLVEQQVRRSPDAPAVVSPAGTLTYGELNRRANLLARHLIERCGARPGMLIGIALERSPAMAVAVLAVLKAGAAYVPLDPAQPQDRLRYIAADTGAPLVLTLSSLAGDLPDTGARIVLLDEQVPDGQDTDLDIPDVPRSAACVIYTSGTTGRPKGVVLTHQGLSNSMRWERAAYRIRPDDRMLHLASFAFSLAIVELLSPLCAGAQVVIAPASAGRDGGEIARLVAGYGVTLLSVVPSDLKLLLEQEPAMPWNALRAVITGADVLPVPLLEHYFAVCPSVPLFNIYGQTESSVDGTYWICAPPGDLASVPVGRPITGTRMYLLDEDMRPVPPGATGEVCTGGVALAHGYLGRPELTAARFVPNPFAEPGSGDDTRLYRSGDLGRWLPDGSIELLGRNDHQVKVNGVRIELEEIEAVLREHPGVGDAVVSVQRAAGPDWAALIAGVPEPVLRELIAEAEAAPAAGEVAR
ncbi:amino acid adenylation domain-containing protein [Nonomuraea sp. NPDC049309]|uniref:non-ribosomal peptide synthetase n=1 Tax=Nonomuraea sp. NPDC049309 TaxID=3364350 RepID=UPI003710045D